MVKTQVLFQKIDKIRQLVIMINDTDVIALRYVIMNNGKKSEAAAAPRPATSRDVAKLAGVSQSSVCRVFDERWTSKISPALREKVLATARELGYCPNAIARSLTAQRSGIIGVIISEDFNEFYYDIMRRITNGLQELGMRVMLFNAAPYRDVKQVLRSLVEYRVDGIIVTAAAISTVAEATLQEVPVPLVLVNIYSRTPFCSSVICDNYTGSQNMAAYLIRSGGRRFAYISAENSKYYDISDRREGFLSGLRQNGIQDCIMECGDYTYESGKAAARRLLDRPDRPDTIFSCGSRMAYGVMDVARYEYGLKIPEDLSVAAYDDTFASALDSYRLTTVQQPSQELSRTAIRLIRQEIDGPAPIETVYAVPSLEIRDSVRRPNE